MCAFLILIFSDHHHLIWHNSDLAWQIYILMMNRQTRASTTDTVWRQEPKKPCPAASVDVLLLYPVLYSHCWKWWSVFSGSSSTHTTRSRGYVITVCGVWALGYSNVTLYYSVLTHHSQLSPNRQPFIQRWLHSHYMLNWCNSGLPILLLSMRCEQTKFFHVRSGSLHMWSWNRFISDLWLWVRCQNTCLFQWVTSVRRRKLPAITGPCWHLTGEKEVNGEMRKFRFVGHL